MAAMAGTTTNASKQLLLDYLTGRAVPLVAPRPTYLGLAFSLSTTPDESTLANISEVTTTGYARVLVPWATPGINPVITKSSADVQFAAMTVDMAPGQMAQYAFLTDTNTGTTGTLLYVWTLTEPLQAKAGKPIFIAAGSLAIQ